MRISDWSSDVCSSDLVKLALLPLPTLGWLAAHDDTIAALTNLRTLAWVIKAGAAMGSNPSGLASHTAIADRLWKHWTKDRADVQALMMRLADRKSTRLNPVTNAKLVCRLLLEKKNKQTNKQRNYRTSTYNYTTPTYRLI